MIRNSDIDKKIKMKTGQDQPLYAFIETIFTVEEDNKNYTKAYREALKKAAKEERRQ